MHIKHVAKSRNAAAFSSPLDGLVVLQDEVGPRSLTMGLDDPVSGNKTFQIFECALGAVQYCRKSGFGNIIGLVEENGTGWGVCDWKVRRRGGEGEGVLVWWRTLLAKARRDIVHWFCQQIFIPLGHQGLT